jgi:uncharacterized protein
MKKQVERRFMQQEFRVSGEAEPPKITGYAAVFGSSADIMGWWTEEIDSHAFDTVMGTNPDVRALFNHDPNLVLGRTTANTLQLSVDARGLAYEIDPPDTQVGRDLMVSMRRKDITQSSYAYIVKRDQWTDNEDESVTRRILEIDELWDVSPVTYPGYAATSAIVRSLPTSMPAETRTRVEKRMNAAGCDCQCAECVAGDCGACSDLDCDDPDCIGSKAARRIVVPVVDERAWRQQAEMRLELARHGR